jgi:hypothetical protein
MSCARGSRCHAEAGAALLAGYLWRPVWLLLEGAGGISRLAASRGTVRGEQHDVIGR